MGRGVMSSVDSDFITERASELIYQGKLDEEVLDRMRALAQDEIEMTEKTYVRRHCSCPYCGERIEIVIRPDTPWGMQVWTRKHARTGGW